MHNVTKEPKVQKERIATKDLPVIPQKRYFTISEAAELCDVKTHVLRYWEQEFPSLSPTKRRGGRRSYRYNEILLLREIRSLLYEQGHTIEGARSKLSGKQTEPSPVSHFQGLVRETIKELENLLRELA